LADLGVIILTHNEELHIERALRCLAPIARHVVVIDSYSSDRTVELARAAGAEVLQNPWVNYAKQFQWGLEHAGLDTAWIMRLDADEVIEPDLVDEIKRRLPALPAEVTGVVLNRKHAFMGRFISHGGRHPLYLLRLWRAGAAHIEQRWMDEHMILDYGRSVVFEGGFADVNMNDLTFFTDKHNKYATREAVDVLNEKYAFMNVSAEILGETSSNQAKIKRFVKTKIYNQLGIVVGPIGYFLYRMVIQLGVLDGVEGLIYHVLQGFWYRFLVAAKVAELEGAIKTMTDRHMIIDELERRTHLQLRS